jgi:hypothetical protein
VKRGLPEGSAPYPNSYHPGGVVVGMCDGSTRFVNETVAGAIWAKLVTPAGESLPAAYRQLPLTSSQASALR